MSGAPARATQYDGVVVRLRELGLSFVVALVSVGCGRLGFADDDLDVVFVDDGGESFDRGSYDAGTAALGFFDGQVKLAAQPPYDPRQVGIYVSRPFDAATDGTTWTALSWVPTAPQGRPLPDDGGADAGYVEGGLDMTANILLLHFPGADASGPRVHDSSGRGHHGELVFSGGGVSPVAGVFGEAMHLDRDAWVRLDGTYFDYGTDDFTYAVWVKNFPCSESNDNRIALGGAGAGDDPHMWIGALCPDACPGGDGAFMNFLDSTRTGPSLSACSGVVLDDGAWHHLAGVKQGHTSPPALVKLFVDGREVGARTFDFGASTFTYDGGELRLGGFNLGDPTYNTRIVVDEAAIWKRALTTAEIEAVHRRGAVRLELQVRACADSVCDDEPFVGPDGTSGSYFSEAELTGAAGDAHHDLGALGLVGRVGQYRARFTTSAASISPGLVRVALSARRR